MPKTIFLAEDDIDDQEFLKEAFLSLDEHVQLHMENSGEKAINYLKSLPEYCLPNLIILDYNLPLISGHQLLEHLSSLEKFKRVRKVVWSTSDSHLYQHACLNSGADAYFVKPSNITGVKNLAGVMLGLCSSVERT